MRTYTIELRVDFVDSDRYDSMLELARMAARELMTTALLLRDKRDPQIAFSTGDMFSKDENMEIITPADVASPEGQDTVTSDGNWSVGGE